MMDWRKEFHNRRRRLARGTFATMILPANCNAVIVFAFSLLLCFALLVAQCCGEHRASRCSKQRSGSSVTLSGIHVYIGRMNLTL